jgi:hypothetical protein
MRKMPPFRVQREFDNPFIVQWLKMKVKQAGILTQANVLCHFKSDFQLWDHTY